MTLRTFVKTLYSNIVIFEVVGGRHNSAHNKISARRTSESDLLSEMTLLFEPVVSSPIVPTTAIPQDEKAPCILWFFCCLFFICQKHPVLPTSIHSLPHLVTECWILQSFHEDSILSYVLSFFLIYLLIMLLQLSHFHPFTQLHPAPPPSHIAPL